MGDCTSKQAEDSSPRKDEPEEPLNFKVLLLGAGESGKSTLVKQLKGIYKVAVDEQEIWNYKTTIHNNTLNSMQVFLEAANKFGYRFKNEEHEVLAKKVTEFAFDADTKLIPVDIGSAIFELSKTKPIKKSLERRNEFWNLDASDYYFANVERFVNDDYQPTEEDCIMARVRTTGIVMTEFDEGNVHFSVVDVAGQRSERKKWVHCFEGVKGLVFLVSLAGYNQVMFEDANHNRMQEALELFEKISNNPLFAETPIFLFLNKKDLFEEMIKSTDLSKCFPEYNGGADVNVALKYVQGQFEKKMHDNNKDLLHVHYIAARYKRDVRYTWEELKATLVTFYKKRPAVTAT